MSETPIIPTPGDPEGDRLVSVINRLSVAVEASGDRLEENDARLDRYSAAISDLAQSERQSRKRLWLLGISVILDVVLSILLAVFGLKVFSTSNDAKDAAALATRVSIQNIDNAYNTCLSANESRLLNVQLWDFVLGTFITPQPGQPPPSDAGIATVKRLTDFVHQTFAPKDCGPDPTPDTPDGHGLPPASTTPVAPPLATATAPPTTS